MIHVLQVVGSTALIFWFLRKSMKLPMDQTMMVLAVAEFFARILGI